MIFVLNVWAYIAIEAVNSSSLGFIYQAGIVEPGLRIHLPKKVTVVELLTSVKPDAYFALARPYQWSF